MESLNISMCMNELLTLEYGEVQSRLKLSACKAVFSALDNVSDAVEISSDDHEIQVAINIEYAAMKYIETQHYLEYNEWVDECLVVPLL